MGNLSKRNILWLVPIAILGLFFYFYGPKDDITDNEHIRYVQSQKIANLGDKPLSPTLENACTDARWVYFETQKGQDVVEFQGNCHDKEIKSQFLVSENYDKFSLGAMLVDAVNVPETERDATLKELLQ